MTYMSSSIYETVVLPGQPPQAPLLVVAPRVHADGTLAFVAIGAGIGPIECRLPAGSLIRTAAGFLWSVADTRMHIFALVTTRRFDAYWRERLLCPVPAFANSLELWRYFRARYGGCGGLQSSVVKHRHSEGGIPVEGYSHALPGHEGE